MYSWKVNTSYYNFLFFYAQKVNTHYFGSVVWVQLKAPKLSWLVNSIVPMATWSRSTPACYIEEFIPFTISFSDASYGYYNSLKQYRSIGIWNSGIIGYGSDGWYIQQMLKFFLFEYVKKVDGDGMFQTWAVTMTLHNADHKLFCWFSYHSFNYAGYI